MKAMKTLGNTILRRLSLVNYKNGRDILPTELLTELQNYVQGALIYVPKKVTNRAGWGELNGARKNIRERNHKIATLYKNGWSIPRLIRHFHLSEDSVKKIVSRTK